MPADESECARFIKESFYVPSRQAKERENDEQKLNDERGIL
jgi:hypothetical protein